MEPCTIDSWDMNIISDSGAQIARPFFRNVQVTNGIIEGEVELNGHLISRLGGLCIPLVDLGIGELSQMTFLFRLKDAGSEIGIFLSGLAVTEQGSTKASFTGTWIAHPPGPQTPAGGDLVTLVLPGSGDTGTSTGTQT